MEQVLRAQHAGVGGEVVAPPVARRDRGEGAGHAAHDLGGHLVEQLLLVADVPVEGGGADVEPGGERADGEGVHALVVEEFERRRDDPLPSDALGHG
ncbi:hypothetical protein BJF90_17955 [Pseudonocardia sp. CNS-004]|nr:hypothetical protein BJF90_17955 [Pseudonocardia sp. CNS-004]